MATVPKAWSPNAGALAISAVLSSCGSCTSPRFFLEYSVSLCMLCCAPWRRMNTMNSATFTSPERLLSKRFQHALSRFSEICSGFTARPFQVSRTSSRNSGYRTRPVLSLSTMVKALYQLPPVWRRNFRASLKAAATLSMAASSSSGQESTSSLYRAKAISLQEASPDRSGSMRPQKPARSSSLRLTHLRSFAWKASRSSKYVTRSLLSMSISRKNRFQLRSGRPRA
mmetsp:Transcript_85635/g.247195  ORF Transcript_85635/g.247195 Transcript_85635/m.247195 type:complete len:227 (+) Transcript_85635:1922-2602(+)